MSHSSTETAAAYPNLNYDPAYYDQVYGNYEKQNPPYKYAHYLGQIRRYRQPPLSLLDVGCAGGRFLNYARRHLELTSVCGVDVNEAAVERAKALMPDALLKAGPEALAEMPTVDVITAFDVLEHIPELDDALESIEAKLAPEGLLVAVVPVYDGPLGPVVHLLDKDPTHIHKMGRRFWVEKLGARFKLLHWHGIIRYLCPGSHYLHWPTKVGRSIAPAILLVAEKR